MYVIGKKNVTSYSASLHRLLYPHTICITNPLLKGANNIDIPITKN